MVVICTTVKNFEDMFIRFDMIHERDGRTDKHTDRHRMTATAALDASIAQQQGITNAFSTPCERRFRTKILRGLAIDFDY